MTRAVLRSLSALLLFAAACHGHDDIGKPCDNAEQCDEGQICDFHDGKGTCQEAHGHDSAGETTASTTEHTHDSDHTHTSSGTTHEHTGTTADSTTTAATTDSSTTATTG